jgi:hypothetical protein
MILYLLILLLLLYVLASSYKQNEGFEMNDDFYSSIYDELWDMIPFFKIQIELMKPYFGNTNNFLCMDSKTGNMCQLLSKNMNIVGLDTYEMTKIAKEKYPELDFISGTMNPHIFKSNLFTHIYCPLFSINTKDMDSYFECIDKWLIHKGYLFIVNYSNLNINQFINKNPSKYFKQNYQYSIELTSNSNSKLIEKIKFKGKQHLIQNYMINKDLDDLDLEYTFIKKLEIPNYGCYLYVYQKN